MGKHSAPDDEDDLVDSLAVAVEADDRPPGRHAAVEPDLPADQYQRDMDAAESTVRRREGGTRADLRLLRTDKALRARCIVAVVVPFLVYTLVLAILGRTDLYLIWIVAPTVTAGVLVGAFLDVAHRRAETAAETRAFNDADTAPDTVPDNPAERGAAESRAGGQVDDGPARQPLPPADDLDEPDLLELAEPPKTKAGHIDQP